MTPYSSQHKKMMKTLKPYNFNINPFNIFKIYNQNQIIKKITKAKNIYKKI